MTIERSVILIRVSADDVPAAGGDTQILPVAYADNPGLLDHLGGDRAVTSHAIAPLPNGDLLVSLFVEALPDASAGFDG